MTDPLHKAGFNHPCKDTCSGWQQGYERGRDETVEGRWREKYYDKVEELVRAEKMLAIAEACLNPAFCSHSEAIESIKQLRHKNE